MESHRRFSSLNFPAVPAFVERSLARWSLWLASDWSTSPSCDRARCLGCAA